MHRCAGECSRWSIGSGEIPPDDALRNAIALACLRNELMR